jgi:uncharacterized membrane protein HdeD (DUF308 family)
LRCQGADRDHFLNLGFGLGAFDQRGDMVRKFLLRLTSHGFFLFLLNAIIRTVTGYLLIQHPDAGAQGVTMLLAALFIVGGLFRAVAAGVIQYPRWGWTVLSGVISVVLGIYLLTTWPTASTYFLGIVIGIDLIFDGAALAGFAGALRSLPSTVERRAA